MAKPRCGSTLVRKVLDKYLHSNDLAINYSSRASLLHPHITGPALRSVLTNFYNVNDSNYHYFTVTRHPIEMLQSYYRFFQPDAHSNYNFDAQHTGEVGISFNDWIIHGKVGMERLWQETAPPHISTDDLSPLSLEAHFCSADNRVISPNIFMLENLAELSAWLKNSFDITFEDIHAKVNPNQANIPCEVVSAKALDKVKAMFRLECELYNL